MPFELSPDRYVYAWVFIKIPPGKIAPNGGDITGALDRPMAEPTHWKVKYRMRYYAEKRNDPWDGQDKRNWYEMIFTGSEEESAGAFMQWAEEVAAGTAIFGGPRSQVEVLMVKGNDAKWYAEVERQKPHWMHIKMQKVGEGEEHG